MAALLGACADLRLLVTSQAPLWIRGERECSVSPQTRPELTRLPAVRDLEENPAVQLFVSCARDVAAICRRLDGLPLALELAAALFVEGLNYSQEVGGRPNMAFYLEGLVTVAVARGEAARAARPLWAAQALFEAVGARMYTYQPDRSRHERTIGAARTGLDEEAWAAAWEEGRALTSAGIVEYALSATASAAG